MKLFPLMAAAAMTTALSAGAAFAESEEFNGCQEIHWTTFGEAVASNDAARMQLFLQMHGVCEPLRATIEVLLCDVDPAACLAVIEPSAGEEEPQDDYIPPMYQTLQSDFAFRAPGQAIGTENSRNENPSSPSSPAESAPSEPASPGGDGGNGGGNDNK